MEKEPLITEEQLIIRPSLANYVLKRPELHSSEVIELATVLERKKYEFSKRY